MRTILAGRQPKALGLVYRDLRRDVHGTQKRCTCACAKTPPDANTQSGLPWEAARIRAGNLRWLPHSFSLQETKGSFLCFWKNPHPSAQSRRWQRTGKGDPHQQGTRAGCSGLPCARNSLSDGVKSIHLSLASGSSSMKLGLAPIISEPLSRWDDLWFKVLIFFLTHKRSKTSRNKNNQHGA